MAKTSPVLDGEVNGLFRNIIAFRLIDVDCSQRYHAHDPNH